MDITIIDFAIRLKQDNFHVILGLNATTVVLSWFFSKLAVVIEVGVGAWCAIDQFPSG